MSAEEVWKPWPRCPRYEASSLGRVRFTRADGSIRIAAAFTNIARGGYDLVHVILDGKKTRRGSHQIVAEAFHGLPQPGQQVRHDDGDPRNNVPDNLLWGTILQNHNDKRRHGTALFGEHHNMAKLRRVDADMIRASKDRGVDLAARFNVSQATISNIRHGKNWR